MITGIINVLLTIAAFITSLELVIIGIHALIL